LLLVVLVIGALAVGGAWLTASAYNDRVYPQVTAGDVAVGSLTPDEAEQKVALALESFLASPVTLQLGEATWTPSAADIGLSVDVEATVRRAFLAGRNETVLLPLLRTLTGRGEPIAVPFVLVLNEEEMQRYLDDVGAQVTRDAASPVLRVSGETVEIVGGDAGITFLPEETRAGLLAALRTGAPSTIPVQVFSQAGPIPPEAAARAEQTAKQIVSAPLRLESEGRAWEITTQQLREWVRSTPGEGALQVGLDEVQLNSYLEGVAREASAPAQSVRLQWLDGRLEVTRPSQNGRRLDVAAAVRTIQRAAPSNSRTVQLPVRLIAPPVTEGAAGSLGIEQLVATGDSTYRGSPPERIANVDKASGAVTGFVVPADAVFSFAEAVGEVTEEAGYQPELVGDGRRSIQGEISGISQVSTTVFRAALRAGLPILERHASQYRHEYYEQGEQPPGTDAVVTLPGQDLKFENTTGGALLVQIVVGDAVMRVELYGPPTGWTVEIPAPEVGGETPAQGEVVWRDPLPGVQGPVVYLVSRPGGDVVVTRRVLLNGVLRSEDSYNSQYDPLPTVVVRE